MNEMRYCVVANIVKERIDESGVIRYGTSAFTGGTKVYLCGRNRDPQGNEVGAIGLTRGKRHQFVMVKRNQITNLRVQKVFKPSILFFLTDMEFNECCWGSSEAERLHAENFVRCWNEANEKAEG